MFSWSPPVSADQGFKPSMRVPAVPDVAGMYVVEVGLVPAQLTAYDVVWLDVG